MNLTGSAFESASWVIPEIILVAFVLVVIIADLLRGCRRFAGALALVGLAVTGIVTFGMYATLKGDGPGEGSQGVFGGTYIVDCLGVLFKVAFLGAALLVGVISIPAIRGWRSGKGEYFTLLLCCTFGMMLMAGANDLLMMYLALEFTSITSYIMAGLLRKNRKSAEASLKYIIYGAASSGVMIYGMTFLYGWTGTLNVTALGPALAEAQVPGNMALVTSVLIMAGFAYKIAAVPFHMWCPDVYEGAPTPVTAFFSVGPKAAGFAMLIRFLYGAFPAGVDAPFEWKLVLALLSVMTMAVGNLGALHQQNLKRLLAYSSIAHAGYILVAFTAFTPAAISSVAFYVVAYVLMNLGAFLVVIILEEKHGIETVDGCRGLGWRSPVLGGLLTVLLISLTGLPPTAGFIGKMLVFSYVIENSIGPERGIGIAVVVVAGVFTVVSLFYYMRIVAAMFLAKSRDGADARPVAIGPVYGAVLWVLTGATLLLGLWWGPLQERVTEAAGKLPKAPPTNYSVSRPPR